MLGHRGLTHQGTSLGDTACLRVDSAWILSVTPGDDSVLVEEPSRQLDGHRRTRHAPRPRGGPVVAAPGAPPRSYPPSGAATHRSPCRCGRTRCAGNAARLRRGSSAPDQRAVNAGFCATVTITIPPPRTLSANRFWEHSMSIVRFDVKACVDLFAPGEEAATTRGRSARLPPPGVPMRYHEPVGDPRLSKGAARRDPTRLERVRGPVQPRRDRLARRCYWSRGT
jgi:hypothetical protein